MARFNILLVSLFLLSGALYAQSFQMNKQIKGVDLPSGIVLSIDQDKHGRVWFATARGIFYSDGINTYGLPEEIADSLGKTPGFDIDEEGEVWVYSTQASPVIYRLQHDNWGMYEIPHAIMTAVSGDKLYFEVLGKGENKQVLLCRNGFLALSKVGSFEWDYHSYRGEGWGELKSCFSVNDKEAMLFFKNQVVSYAGEGLQPVSIDDSVLPGPVWDVEYNKGDSLYYFLGENFLAAGKALKRPETIIDQDFSKVNYNLGQKFGLQVKEGQVFYFFDSQLFKYDPVRGETLEISTFDALKSFYINTSFIDRENVIWIGTVRGVVNLPTLRFRNYDKWEGLLEHEVSAILNLGPGENIYGFNNGVQHWKDGQVIYESKGEGQVGEPKNRVTTLHRDKNGIVWIASAMRGLGRYHPSTHSISFTQSPDKSFVMHALPKGDSLIIVSGKHVYLSDINAHGTNHFRKEITDTLFEEVLQMPVKPIRKIDFLDDGKMMIMAEDWPELKGKVFEKGRLMAFAGYDWEAMKEGLLLATHEGLKVYDGRELKYYELNGQQVDRPVYALAKDHRGNIWAGTDQGVAIIGNGTIRYFNEYSGLTGNEVNRGAFSVDENGRIQIGTQNGLSVFIPEEDGVSFPEPKVAVNNIKVLGVAEGEVSRKNIPYEFNNVEFEFSAISFLQMANFTVSYMLEGFHDEWQHLQNPRTNKLQFSNLPPGDYQLKLKASLGGQFESNVAYSKRFSIIKPVYLQTWFIGLVILFFLMLGFGLNILINQFKERGILQKSIDKKDQEIKIAADQFRNVWDSSQDGLMLLNLKGNVIAVNPSMIKMAGVENTAAMDGRHIKDFFRDPEYFYENRARILDVLSISKGDSLEALVPFHSGDKNIDLFVTKVNPELEQDDVVLMVFRDVTDKKIYEEGLKEAKERAEEANRIKTNFLSNMSHEIRTPLNGILGSTENIIFQNKDNHTLVSQLEIIMESGERLLNTINSILDMSKIEANKMEVTYEDVNVNDFLSHLLIPLKMLAIRKNLLLTARFETKPFIVRVDKRYFEMIVNNIVGNAIKYSDEGLIKVKVKKMGEHLWLEVKDTGIGMSDEFIAKIYSPFEQESGGYDRQFEGTGLGLSITKSLIELLKGTIEIKSEKNEGTTVWVTLPVN